MSPEQKVGPLQTVDRALQVLLLFSPERPVLRLSDVTEALGIAKSMGYRLLESLRLRGFLMYDNEARRYRLGLQVLTLGQVAYQTLDLRRVARPHMQELAAATGEAAFLTVLDGDSTVVIEKIESAHPLRLAMQLGGRSPLHAGASNRVLLAYLPPAVQEAYIQRGLARYTDATITDPDRLREELVAIRERGYDVSVGQFTPEVGALAVCIRTLDHEPMAAVSIGGPATHFTDSAIPGFVDAVRKAAAGIAREVGGTA